MSWAVVGVALVIGVLAGVVLTRRGTGTGPLVLDRRLAGMSEDLDRRLGGLDQRLHLGLDAVMRAQGQTAGAAADVRERVAQVSAIAEQVLEQAQELARLEDLLRPPQARGAFGEVLLEQVLAQGLPAGCYQIQHQFRSGARVDALLRLGEASVPIDAKFPLDAFARMAAARERDPARTVHRRAFVRDARRHVDAIATKYIRPDEGTFDFALCYVPSEAVYYEFLREDAPGDSAFRYAVGRRVFPVSPTTLYAYLVSVGLGLRGLRVEANARRVVDALAGLAGELERFRDEFEVVGRHLFNARSRWDEAARRLDRFDGRLAEVAERAGTIAAASVADRSAAPDDGAGMDEDPSAVVAPMAGSASHGVGTTGVRQPGP